jgi:hypothetical protein
VIGVDSPSPRPLRALAQDFLTVRTRIRARDWRNAGTCLIAAALKAAAAQAIGPSAAYRQSSIT